MPEEGGRSMDDGDLDSDDDQYQKENGEVSARSAGWPVEAACQSPEHDRHTGRVLPDVGPVQVQL